jgi:hypothetical protein
MQGRLFNELPRAESGYADLNGRIKAAAVADARECRWSREQMAEVLSGALERHITEAQIDAMLATAKEGHRMPADLVAAWVRVTGSRRVIELLCEGTGLCVMDAAERDLAEFGRMVPAREKSEERLGDLRRSLWHRL